MAGSGRRRVASVLAVLVMPLLLAELLLRGAAATGWLPAWPSRDADMDASLLYRVQAPVADVLLVGDSLTRRGVDPAVLGGLLEGVLGQPVDVANAAQLGVGFGDERLVVRALAQAGRLPRIVLVGISMGNYGGFRADAPNGSVETSGMGEGLVDCTGLDPAAWLTCQAGRWSVAWRWRGAADRLLADALAASDPGGTTTVSGWLRRDGFEAVPSATSSELDELLRTTYRGEVVSVTPERVAGASEDLGALMDELHAAGASVTLFEVPYPPPLLEELLTRQPDLMEVTERAVDQLAAAAGQPIVRVPRMGEWWQPADSSDLKHLSGDGAQAFTRQLWQMPGWRSALTATLAHR